VIGFDAALDPEVEPDPRFDGREAITLTEIDRTGGESRHRDVSLLFIATPETLKPHGLDLATVDSDTDVITPETGELSMNTGSGPESVDDVQTITPGYSSIPSTFITPEAVRERGWEAAGAGLWLVETSSPITNDQSAATRERAAAAGLTIETRDHRGGLATLRSGATAVGMLLAFGVLAMTVGLVRSETAGDLRILTATGATSTTRRTLTAATAGALALLGSALGIAGAYLGLAAGYLSDLSNLIPIPFLHLAIVALGLPCVATVAGWLLAGREPVSIARQPLE